MQKTNIYWIIAIVIAMFATGLITKCSADRANKIDLRDLSEAYLDTLTQTRTETGALESKISVITTKNLELLGTLGTNDATMKRLAETIKDYDKRNKKLESALAINNSTNIYYTDTVYNTIVDTVKYGNNEMPVYAKAFFLKNPYDDSDTIVWIDGNVKLGMSTFEIFLGTKNRYDITIGRERKNLFHKYKTYAVVRNLNPFDVTEEVKVYSSSAPRRKNWVVSANVGYGFASYGLSPFIGIGIGYKIFEF